MRGATSMPVLLSAVGAWVARLLPRRLAWALGDTLALAVWALDRGRRDAVDQNLRRLVPDLPAAAHQRLVRATFRQKARATIAAWQLTPQSVASLVTTVELEGRPHLTAALAQGRGAIVVAPHLGPWDVGAAWFAAAGHRPCAVVEHLPGGAFEAEARRRQALGIDVVSHDQPRRLRQTLRDGRVLILMADRVIGGSGLEVPFAGGVRPVPVGPAVLARLTGAPIVGAWIAFDPSSWRLVAELELLTPPDGGDVAAMTAAIGAWCGRAAARFPDQWFVFNADWREPGTAVRLK